MQTLKLSVAIAFVVILSGIVAEPKDNYATNPNYFDEHNRKFKKGEVSFEVGENKYTKLPLEVAHKRLFGLREDESDWNKGVVLNQTIMRGPLPETVDWVAAGAVTSVKDQDSCSACYAYSVVGALEGMLKIQYKRPLTELSIQNVIDCSESAGNWGCGGGSRTYVYRYVKESGGLNTEAQYPLVNANGECKFQKTKALGKIKYHGEIPKGDEKALKDIVARIGPVSVGVDASPPSFLAYRGGVYLEPTCNPNNLNHAVLVVGYGVEDGKDYWLIKNSWGPSWGVNGFMKLARNMKNQCGVASIANYPIRA